MTDASEKLAEIRALEAEKSKLYDELGTSLALKSLWPEVFDQGPCKSVAMTGPGPRKLGRRSEVLKHLDVTDGAGETRRFAGADVPVCLRRGFEPETN